MAGDIEEPFRLNFQVDSFRSGSISFGRYESESLCWERWSSFSHNRYLEEVEKCSKPGSVTEKKAYFEAHFRRKGFPGQSSSECQNEIEYQTNGNDISAKMGCDEEIDCIAIFDESPDGSSHEGEAEVIGTSFSEPRVELVSETKRADSIPKDGKVEGADDAGHASSLSVNSESGIEMKERLDGETAILDRSRGPYMAIRLFPDNHVDEKNSDTSQKDDQVSLPEEKAPSEDKRSNLKPRDSLGQSRRYTPRNASKGSDNKANKTVPLRSGAEKKTSVAPSKSLTPKTKKYERDSKIKGVNEINSAEKELIRRITVEPHSSASQKVSSRMHQSANRVKPAIGSSEPQMRRASSRSSFKGDERALRRTEEKTKAEIKQLSKSLSFKAIPMPSFYRGALREPDVNKAKASNLSSKSSHPGTRTSKSTPLSSKPGLEQVATKTIYPPQASGTTSCHSTVTSESRIASPAGTSNGHHSQARARTPVSRKKDQREDKLVSLRHNKAAEGNWRQKMRAERNTHTSFNRSSKTGRMAVGVAS